MTAVACTEPPPLHIPAPPQSVDKPVHDLNRALVHGTIPEFHAAVAFILGLRR